MVRASAGLLFDGGGDGGANGRAQEVRRCETLLRQASRRQTSIARWMLRVRGRGQRIHGDQASFPRPARTRQCDRLKGRDVGRRCGSGQCSCLGRRGSETGPRTLAMPRDAWTWDSRSIALRAGGGASSGDAQTLALGLVLRSGRPSRCENDNFTNGAKRKWQGER